MTQRFLNRHRHSRDLSRRDVLTGTIAASILPGAVMAGSTSQTALYDIVAEKVRALTQGMDITLRILLPTGSQANVAPISAAFHDQTGIKIKISTTPVDEINSVLLLDTLSGEGNYDLALPATKGLPDLVANGSIIGLDDYAARHEPPGFRQNVLFGTGDIFDGSLYGFQTDGDAYLMFYNRDMLEDDDARRTYQRRHGTALEIPLTWEELDRQMQFFHRPDQGTYGGLLFRTPEYVASEFWVRFHAKGLWPFSADMTPQIASPAGVSALRDMIAATQWQSADVHHLDLFGNWQRFAQGDVYCNLGWGGSQKYFNAPDSPVRDRLLFGPTPGGMVNDQLLLTPYFNWGWNYVVSANCPIPEVAYLFALFAASPEMSTRAVRQRDGFFDPFRPEHYKDPSIIDTYSPEFLKVHRQSLIGAIPDLYLNDQGSYLRVLSEGIMLALNGSSKPLDALERISSQWKLLNAKSDLDKQTQRWRLLRAKYPEAVRQHLHDL